MTFEMVETKPDGLYLAAGAVLQQLLAEDSLQNFADGLLPRVIASTLPAPAQSRPLTDILFRPAPSFGGTLAALLVLDAEVIATVNGDRRAWPLPGFLSYRARLEGHQPEFVRLPPLNSDGRYLLSADDDRLLLLRFDMHPQLRVLGHIRIAIAGEQIPPQRLTSVEHRLERRTLSAQLLSEIKIAGATGDLENAPSVLLRLVSLLQEFAEEKR